MPDPRAGRSGRQELRRLARAADNIKILTLCGGVSIGPQIASLEHGAHVIVGTPGRVQEHLKKAPSSSTASTPVLDEADRMLDMGFYDAIAEIIGQTPAKRQTLLFSATYPASIEQLAASFMRAPQQVRVESLHTDSQIEQRFYEIDPEQRLDAVARLLASFRPESCVAFCFTKQQCELVEYLNGKGISAAALNGDLEQRDRDQVTAMFANRSLSVLVATDVAARGLDIDALDMVINVELARDPEIHVHRIGRTGRAGNRAWPRAGGPSRSPSCPGHREAAEVAAQLAFPDELKAGAGAPLQPPMVTLCIAAGRRTSCARATSGRPDRRRRPAGQPGRQDRHLRLPGVRGGRTRCGQTGPQAPERR